MCLPSADRGAVVLGDLLVGLLAARVQGALDGVRDVVSGVVDLVHCDGGCWLVWIWFG